MYSNNYFKKEYLQNLTLKIFWVGSLCVVSNVSNMIFYN